MKRFFLITLVALLFILHQDIWFWRAARPLIFGFLPVGLFYHACYTLAASGLMWLLVAFAWPVHLEEDVEVAERTGETGGGSSQERSRPR